MRTEHIIRITEFCIHFTKKFICLTTYSFISGKIIYFITSSTSIMPSPSHHHLAVAQGGGGRRSSSLRPRHYFNLLYFSCGQLTGRGTSRHAYPDPLGGPPHRLVSTRVCHIIKGYTHLFAISLSD